MAGCRLSHIRKDAASLLWQGTAFLIWQGTISLMWKGTAFLIWQGTAFSDEDGCGFRSFHDAISAGGVGAMELVALDMKRRGMWV